MSQPNYIVKIVIKMIYFEKTNSAEQVIYGR